MVAGGLALWREARYRDVLEPLFSVAEAGKALRYGGQVLGIHGLRLDSLLDPVPLRELVAQRIAFDQLQDNVESGALGAVGSRPVDITAFLTPLTGRPPDAESIAAVADAADKPARPLDNTDLSHYWRKRMTRVYIERALRDACGLDPLAGRLTAQVKAATS